MEEVRRPGPDAPLLSITVLNYNYGRFLPACLDSILAQTFRDFELIVIDDCSTDNSRQVVESYLSDPRVRLVAHAKNAGFQSSLIEGTERQSRGEYLTVISADDLIFRKDAFELQMSQMIENPQAVMSFSAFDRFFSETGHVFDARRPLDHDQILPKHEAFRRFMTDRNVWAAHSGTIIRKTAYVACGGYGADVTVGLDFDLFVKLALEGDFAYRAAPLHGYRAHANQMSVAIEAARRNTPEFLKIIDLVCDRAEQRGWDIGTIRRDAIRNHLGGLALQDAFNDRRRLTFERCWSAVKHRPWVALASRDFWLAVIRVVAGKRVFDGLRRAFGRRPAPDSKMAA